MDFTAHPLTVDNLFSIRKQYFVSRNQREFSWGEEQLEEFWLDLLSNISFDQVNNTFKFEEYFLGAIVLAGNEDGFRLSIVDGQQRITVITILICAICQKLKSMNSEQVSKGLYDNYIEGTAISDSEDPTNDNAPEKYFKLDRQSDSDYFKLAIQYTVQETIKIKTYEDGLLKAAYDFFYSKLSSIDLACDLFNIRPEEVDDSKIVRAVRTISVQLTTKFKIIRVIVDNEDDAYVIFEILNARGLDLDSADLIKNKIFSDLRSTHPVDYAQKYWDELNYNFSERSKNFRLSIFIRHWWNAHYPVVSEGSLYKAFKEKVSRGEFTSKEILERICKDSFIYSKIMEPRFDDWREQHSKKIYYNLSSLKTFNVSICRPFILSLFEAFDKRKIRYKDMVQMLNAIEKFHFCFNAICSMRPSGVENTYSAAARKLLSSANRREGAQTLNELKVKLEARLPPKDTFIEKFLALRFTNKKTSHRKLIQYIFFTMERHIRGNDEVIPLDITLEHITPQSKGGNSVGKIGNLIPLGTKENNIADTLEFRKKVVIYEGSNFIFTKEFAQTNKQNQAWEEQDIDRRSVALANIAYDEIWKF